MAGAMAAVEQRQDVDAMLAQLDRHAAGGALPVGGLVALLLRLRQQTTVPASLPALATGRALAALARYGFDRTIPPDGSRAALRALANVLLLQPAARQLFVDQALPAQAVRRMRDAAPDDELPTARLLLLCTYKTTLDYAALFEHAGLHDVVCGNIQRHADSAVAGRASAAPLPQNQRDACDETLKLLYNLTAYCPSRVPDFAPCVVHLLRLLDSIPLPSPPLQPPFPALINALANLDLAGAWSGPSPDRLSSAAAGSFVYVDRLVHILDSAVGAYSETELERQALSLMQVLLKLAELDHPALRAHLQSRLLPSDEDRKTVIGKSDSLSSRLLRLSSDVAVTHLRQLVPALFFELSGKDTKQFVQNIGYGYASGYLISRGIHPPAEHLEPWTQEGKKAEGMILDIGHAPAHERLTSCHQY